MDRCTTNNNAARQGSNALGKHRVLSLGVFKTYSRIAVACIVMLVMSLGFFGLATNKTAHAETVADANTVYNNEPSYNEYTEYFADEVRDNGDGTSTYSGTIDITDLHFRLDSRKDPGAFRPFNFEVRIVWESGIFTAPKITTFLYTGFTFLDPYHPSDDQIRIENDIVRAGDNDVRVFVYAEYAYSIDTNRESFKFEAAKWPSNGIKVYNTDSYNDKADAYDLIWA